MLIDTFVVFSEKRKRYKYETLNRVYFFLIEHTIKSDKTKKTLKKNVNLITNKEQEFQGNRGIFQLN